MTSRPTVRKLLCATVRINIGRMQHLRRLPLQLGVHSCQCVGAGVAVNPESVSRLPISREQLARLPVQVGDCQVQVPSTQFSQRMVCEFHRKVSSFVQGGQRMRFCQGCLRVEPLDLFDDDKRRAVSAQQRCWQPIWLGRNIACHELNIWCIDMEEQITCRPDLARALSLTLTPN